MYVDEIDFEAVTIEKIVDLVFTEMIHDKMQQLEKEELGKQDQTDGNHRSRFKKCSEVLDHYILCVSKHVKFTISNSHGGQRGYGVVLLRRDSWDSICPFTGLLSRNKFS